MHSGFLQEQHHMTSLPHLQLFQKYLTNLKELQISCSKVTDHGITFLKVPVGYTLDNIDFVGNENATDSARPVKRSREPEPLFTQQKRHISLNNNVCQDYLNPVSTGLKLSYEDDSRNSSVTSINENLKAFHPVTPSLTNSIKLEMDRQKELVDHFVKVQGDNIAKGIRELNRKHTVSLLNSLEKEVAKKLSEKETEIANLNQRNMELVLKIKQVTIEAQSWHYRAKYNESVVISLKNNLQQIIAQNPVHGKEGYGDSEVDDAASYTNVNALRNPNLSFSTKPLNCKACNGKEVCVLLLPCRHLCLCKDCELFTEKCPVCEVTRTESVHVFMS